MGDQVVVKKLQFHHILFCYDPIILFHGCRVILILLLLLINIIRFFLRPKLKVGVLDADEELRNLLILLPRVVLAYNKLWQAREGEKVIVHDTLMFDYLDEFLIHYVHLIVGIFRLFDQSQQIFRGLSTFRHTSQEIIQRLLIFVLSAKIVLEVRVDLVALMYQLLVVREHD